MTRDELYALVWTDPLVHIARRLGISSARLRKICQDYNIPLPPAGHWTKQAHGMTTERPSLPEAGPNLFARINSAIQRLGEVPLHIADTQLDDFDLKFDGPETSPAHAAPAVHRTTAILERALEDAAPDHEGFLNADVPQTPIVKVGPGSVRRTLRVVDGFMWSLERRGIRISGDDEPFRILAKDEGFCLRLYEIRSRDRRGDEGGGELRPSGRLCMEITAPQAPQSGDAYLVGRWFDGRHKSIEASFEQAVDAVVAAASSIRHWRTRAEELQRTEDIAAEQRRREAAQREREQRVREHLLKKAAAYAQYESLARFAVYLTSVADPNAPDSAGRMTNAVLKLVEEMRQQFQVSSLNQDLAWLRLLEGDDVEGAKLAGGPERPPPYPESDPSS